MYYEINMSDKQITFAISKAPQNVCGCPKLIGLSIHMSVELERKAYGHKSNSFQCLVVMT